MNLASAPASPKGKILVVDDDRLVLATVTHGLARAGYDVIDADNGDDAILLAREHKPDLALLDIRMEGKSGFDVADYLRTSLGTPFMFLSAFADDDTVAQVKALGAVAYLVKPLDIAQIVPTVEAALSSVRSRRAPLPAATRPGTSLAQPAASGHPLADPVPVAVGILMHRYSLPRQEALTRLHRLAEADGRSLHAQASALLDAVELLSRPAAG
ncbi:response regulator [Ideonella sp. DXS29W]|uniref:Response regulator n=1 Tax=Ideonella lacteola TaxID=2984193 RepID=A0ABU9BXN6_9BURK